MTAYSTALRDKLFTLLPDQFGSFMATLILPLAFLWLIIAYLDRGRELRREAAHMRAFLAQLTYPAISPEIAHRAGLAVAIAARTWLP